MSTPPDSSTSGRGIVFYHDHMVDMLRTAVGRQRADLLLHDAAIGGRVQQNTLAKACRGEFYQSIHEKERTYAIKGVDQDPYWQGPMLHLSQKFPQSILNVILGMRLGDVVEGAGGEDHIITQAEDRADGTMLVIKTNPVRADNIQVSPLKRHLGPVRRRIQNLKAKWQRDFLDKSNQRTPTLGSIGAEIFIFLLMLCLPFLCLGLVNGPLPEGNWPYFVIAIIMFPVTWMLTGVFASITLEVRRYLSSRKKKNEPGI